MVQTDRDQESARKLVLRAFLDRVWSSGEVAAVDDFIADTYVIHNDPGDPWEGQTLTREGFKDRLIRSRAVAPDQTFSAVEMIEEGDRVAVSWRWEGTHSAEIAGIPATGRRIAMTGITIYSFDGDRLSGHWQLADRLGVYRQLNMG